MNKLNSTIAAAILLMLVVITLAVYVAATDHQQEESPQIVYAKEAIAIRWLWIGMAMKVVLGIILLAFLAGLAYAAVRLTLKRAMTIYPDRSGLYPVVDRKVGKIRVFHDPNRAPVAATLYTPEGVTFVVSPEPGPGQLQVTGQAQAAQALRAAASGVGLTPDTAERIVRPQTPLVKPLPPVEVWDIEPTHVERLLEESTGGNDE